MDKDITPLMDSMQKSLESLQSKCEEAKNNALSAMNSADSAESDAHYARDYADACDDRLNEANTLYQDCYKALQALRAKLEDPDRLESTGMAADMAIHKPKVMRLNNNGFAPPRIASELGISEFLVNQILTASKAAA